MSEKIPKKILILDYDGVIVDSMKIFYEGVKFVSHKMNLGLSDEVCNSSKSWEVFYSIMQKSGADITKATEFFHEYCDEMKQPGKYNLFPGMKEFIEEINQKCDLVLFTDRHFDNTYTGINYHKLTPFFQEVITRDCTKVRKPDPAGIYLALKKLGRKKEDIFLYVGDSSVDFLAAQEAGINFLGVESGANSKTDWESMYTESIPDLTHLGEYLKKTGN